VPVDKRYERSYPGDVESPPRVIEIKSTYSNFRGWFLPLQRVQVEHARMDPDFYIYVVENVGQGDPALFTLRILTGEPLREMAAKASERSYFEVPWPTAHYDATRIEGTSIAASQAPRVSVVDAAPPSAISDAIADVVQALGGEADLADIVSGVERLHPGRWKDIGTAVADLTYPGSASSLVLLDRRILVRVSKGRYRLPSYPGPARTTHAR
jgi:hypothetical protein